MSEVIIDNARIAVMRQDASLVAKFPFLNTNIAKQGRCCHKGTTFVPDFTAIRRAIGGLSPDQRQALKQALGATKVTVHVPQGRRTEVLTF